MSKKKIMIAEDDEGILEAIQIMLEDAGYEVSTTVDGNAILNMQTDLPDLLILDIWLSGIDGTEICKQLKGQEITKNIPVIMCSANKDTQHLARECGADDFIPKPFEMDNLLSKVDKYTRLNNA